MLMKQFDIYHILIKLLKLAQMFSIAVARCASSRLAFFSRVPFPDPVGHFGALVSEGPQGCQNSHIAMTVLF